MKKEPRDVEQERFVREEEKRLAETERRGEELREAWRRRHPERGQGGDRAQKDKR